jgi:hypothetical protein
MKKFVIPGLLILAIISGCGAWFLQRNFDRKIIDQLTQQSATQIAGSKFQIDQLNSKNEVLISDRDKLLKDLSDANQEKVKLTTELANTNTEKFDAQRKSNSLDASMKCEDADQYSFDLRSNSSVNESLKIYAGDKIGSIKSSDWKTIWSNSKAAIHYLRGETIMMVFVVSFKDDIGEAYIFEPSYHCYLVMPQ